MDLDNLNHHYPLQHYPNPCNTAGTAPDHAIPYPAAAVGLVVN
jgi:hypothetical protein